VVDSFRAETRRGEWVKGSQGEVSHETTQWLPAPKGLAALAGEGQRRTSTDG